MSDSDDREALSEAVGWIRDRLAREVEEEMAKPVEPLQRRYAEFARRHPTRTIVPSS
jgi:hypothetical protein